jgi:hypothetical protein
MNGVKKRGLNPGKQSIYSGRTSYSTTVAPFPIPDSKLWSLLNLLRMWEKTAAEGAKPLERIRKYVYMGLCGLGRSGQPGHRSMN